MISAIKQFIVKSGIDLEYAKEFAGFQPLVCMFYQCNIAL